MEDTDDFYGFLSGGSVIELKDDFIKMCWDGKFEYS